MVTIPSLSPFKQIIMTRKKAIEIVKNLTRTIDTMGRDGIQPKTDQDIFKLPRPKKSELIKKRKQIKDKYNLK